MTKILEETLNFVEKFQAERGYSPSRLEIAEAMGVSTASIQERLIRLKKLGKVTWTAGHYRSLTIVKNNTNTN